MSLIIGHESSELITLLISLTNIKSENQIDALTDHFCKGYPKTLAAQLNDVLPTNFSKSIKSINRVAGIVDKINEL